MQSVTQSRETVDVLRSAERLELQTLVWMVMIGRLIGRAAVQ